MLTDQTNSNKNYMAGPHENIPFVDFSDIDRDGMMDMIFYHDKNIYVYYNMH